MSTVIGVNKADRIEELLVELTNEIIDNEREHSKVLQRHVEESQVAMLDRR